MSSRGFLDRGFLAERDESATELMDEPGGDVATLERTYERFRLINAVVSNPRAVCVMPACKVETGTGGVFPRDLA